jgi:hypothetical protein
MTAVALVLRPEAIYWRRRVTTLALFAVLVIALVTLAGRLGGVPHAASGPSSPQLIAERTHVVAPGDTLWIIARSVQPTGDVRPLVQELADARHGAPLEIGERMRVPEVTSARR